MQEMKVYLKKWQKEGWVGAWFTCPVSSEELKEKLDVDYMGELYIEDYDLPFSVPEKMPVWLLNMYCREVQSMEGTPMGKELKTIIMEIFGGSFEEFMNWKEEISFYAAYGRKLMEREDFLVTPSGVFS